MKIRACLDVHMVDDGITGLQLKNMIHARYGISVIRQRLYIFNQIWNTNIPVADTGLQMIKDDEIMASKQITDASWMILDVLPEDNPEVAPGLGPGPSDNYYYSGSQEVQQTHGLIDYPQNLYPIQNVNLNPVPQGGNPVPLSLDDVNDEFPNQNVNQNLGPQGGHIVPLLLDNEFSNNEDDVFDFAGLFVEPGEVSGLGNFQLGLVDLPDQVDFPESWVQNLAIPQADLPHQGDFTESSVQNQAIPQADPPAAAEMSEVFTIHVAKSMDRHNPMASFNVQRFDKIQTVGDLKKKIYQANPEYQVSKQLLSFKGTLLVDSASLADIESLQHNSIITVDHADEWND